MSSRSSIALFDMRDNCQIFEGVHFEIQIGGSKKFRSTANIVFLFSGMSELSKNIFGYNSPQNWNEFKFFS